MVGDGELLEIGAGATKADLTLLNRVPNPNPLSDCSPLDSSKKPKEVKDGPGPDGLMKVVELEVEDPTPPCPFPCPV